MSAEPESTSEDSDGEPGARPNAESDRNSWTTYGLVFVLVGVVVLGLLRPLYPTATALAIGSFLALFGVFVGYLAFRERVRDS